jgi:hypothetical protein
MLKIRLRDSSGIKKRNRMPKETKIKTKKS